MKNPIAKLLGVLPPGARLVVGGTVVLGASAYVYMALVGYSLSTVGAARVTMLWTIVMSVGWGLFQPVELELTRLVAARKVAGHGALPAVRRMLLLAMAILVAVCGVLAVAARPIADQLFSGDRSLVVALAGGLAGLAVSSVARGALAGLGLFGPYGTQLAVDGGLRIGLAGVAAAVGLHSAMAFGLILFVSPLLASLIGLRDTLADRTPGPEVSWKQLTGGLGLLIASVMLSQLVVNATVVCVRLLSPKHSEASDALVFAIGQAVVMARAPLFAYSALQASMVSALSGAAAAGNHAEFRKVLTRTTAIVAAMCIGGGLPVIVLGSRLNPLLFNAKDVLGPLDFVWLVFGTLCYVLATVFGQALMSSAQHRRQLVGWTAGSVALVAVALAPGDVGLRAELAYLAGSLVSAVLMLWSLYRAFPSRPAAVPSDRSAAEPLRTS
ncbi:hypothetical protein ACIG0C_14785 [Kitasatospora aureofaciens]|uniref:Polysaccharide biosynthesis protein n=1 Tax=Kitasatospora aureofaciens TaxID=1894 RepID=A0A1E7NAD8_KITAU|nr:hypothetical protein [Kitasatospora aureofaciens]QEV01170.1 hypothetical protein CP971_19670 [Streptomyces viridifaciens]ARF79922.1 hypothetical protein B6264_14315 [Kitasatospora aureofaciens]OEV37665.1 hypothetical protein HS99_0025525 [Kitasatospora aureofaciens]UKZ07530.1 hypothetical protein BOQ63_026550 [Streptomyces viridifaciens]GGU91053.1 hypothetical protein GCM10010502_50340 [Kitasatospora aureofaciens]